MDVLKGRLVKGFKSGSLLSFLVVLQFTISVTLIIGTLVVSDQLSYMQQKNIGFNRNQVLIVKNIEATPSPTVFKQEIKQIAGVTSATLSRFEPTGNERWHNFGNIKESSNSIQTEFWPVDEDYLTTMGINLTAGRNFSSRVQSDSSATLLNETAAALMNFRADPLDRRIYYGSKEFHVIGVVKDFNFNSLKENITPLVFVLTTPLIQSWSGIQTDLSIRVGAGRLPVVLAALEKSWKDLSLHQQLDYSFMDEDFGKIYRSEQRLSQLFGIFTTLAILIACLGLFSLAAYAAEQRRKEIGIRKVLGAETTGIVALLSKDFLKLVFLSILIAAPIAWLTMHKWLQGFAYRDAIHWLDFVLAATGALIIAFVTISFQSVKAAIMNPVDSLRSE